MSPPDEQEAAEISSQILDLANKMADDFKAGRRAVREWIGDDPDTSMLRVEYLATITPTLAYIHMRKIPGFHDVHDSDEFWALDFLNNNKPKNAGQATVMQSLAAHLNKQHDTARAIIVAAANAGGINALVDIAAEGIYLLQSVLRSLRDNSTTQ